MLDDLPTDIIEMIRAFLLYPTILACTCKYMYRLKRNLRLSLQDYNKYIDNDESFIRLFNSDLFNNKLIVLELDLTNIDNIILDCISDMKNLNILSLINYNGVSIPSLLNIKELYVQGCNNIETLSNSPSIVLLNIYMCNVIKQILLSNLEELSIANCDNIENIDNLENIIKLDITNCNKLKKITNFSKLKILYIYKCDNLEIISQMDNLNILDINNCKYIISLRHIPEIIELYINNCNNLTHIYGYFYKLKILIINGNNCIKNFMDLTIFI